jgi:hypothetical protein
MLRPSTVLAVACLALAGCASPGAEEPQTDFSDLDLAVTEDTGAIRGIVVDERIRPVAGASVKLTGGLERTTTSDDQGRFVFSGLTPGTYFLTVTSPAHKEVQSSADVVAGLEEPPLVRVQLERLFQQDPYSVQVTREGFFECSQAGAGLYASSNCVYDPYRWALGSPSPSQPVDNVTQQEREWHSDVSPGWQQLVFEMSWAPTSQGTSTSMGIVISTYKPEREGTHHFAELEGGSPIRGQIDVGEEHETASGVEPTEIPEEGMANMSYFVSVRPSPDSTCAVLCAPPGLAVNQQFTLYLTMFHYGVPPEGWSLVNGDELPF